jgi:hypothetical protein
MAKKFGVAEPRVKLKIRRKGRHSKVVKRRDKKQSFFTKGSTLITRQQLNRTNLLLVTLFSGSEPTLLMITPSPRTLPR